VTPQALRRSTLTWLIIAAVSAFITVAATAVNVALLLMGH